MKEETGPTKRPMKIKYLPTGSLVPYEANPRNIGPEAIAGVAASIREFGWIGNPIVVGKDNVVVAGHNRLLAAKELGLEKVPVVVADTLTDEQLRAFRLADNKTGELATWDTDLLQKELDALGDFEVDMATFGFTDETPDSPGDGPDADPPIAPGSGFRYQSQYGVIVMCENEDEQERVYNELNGQGYNCKVVTT